MSISPRDFLKKNINPILGSIGLLIFALLSIQHPEDIWMYTSMIFAALYLNLLLNNHKKLTINHRREALINNNYGKDLDEDDLDEIDSIIDELLQDPELYGKYVAILDGEPIVSGDTLEEASDLIAEYLDTHYDPDDKVRLLIIKIERKIQ